MRGVFVLRESGTVGGDFEQHSTRFAEVDRFEPEAIDHRREAAARLLELIAHRKLLLVVSDAPRKMVHGADAPRSALLLWRATDVDDAGLAAGRKPTPAAVVADRGESENFCQKKRRSLGALFPQASAVQPANLMFFRHRAVIPRRKHPSRRIRALDERQTKAVHVGDRKVPIAETDVDVSDLYAVAPQPIAPERQAARRNFQARLDGETVAEARRRLLLPRKEREVAPGMAVRVGVEQMIRTGIVLIDRAFDETHAEDAGIEIEVLLRWTCDGRDVMQSVHPLHAARILRLAGSILGAR